MIRLAVLVTIALAGTPAPAPAADGTKVTLRGSQFGKILFSSQKQAIYLQVLCHDIDEFGGLWLVVKASGKPVPSSR